MLEAAFIRDNLDAVKANCANRGVKADVDRVVQLDDERRRLAQETQRVQQRQNEVSKLIPKEKDAARKQELIAEGKTLREQAVGLEKQQKQAQDDLHAALLTIPNMTHPDAPVSNDPADNKVIRKWGEPRKFDFTPKDHVALAEALDLVDFEAGASVAGQKFYYLKNEAALLELALVQYAMQTLVKEGYTPIITPDVARVEVLEGIGFIPRDPDPEKRQIYTIEGTDLCLIATAEITLGGMHRNHTFDELDLPKKYVGLSHCFRTEAGAPGRDTRGLYRVHQFTKVEMFAFCTPDQSEDIHLELLRIEESIFQGLGLPYHVIDTCTGDLGGPAYRKYDLEAWMPGRGQAGEYGEVTSTSNCTAYQARRLGVRYKIAGQKGTHFVHTLNGTAVAVTRAILAILENNQQADGSVTVPEVLRPWLGKDRIEPRPRAHPSMTDAPHEEELPPHELLEEIGRGAFGVVHRARDLNHDCIVALKQLPPDLLPADEIPLFFHEIRAAALIRHPHLLPLFAAGMHQGRPCFTMQLAVNKSLAERRDQFTDPRAAADLVEKLARAVAAAHAHGLLHGRLTPSRVLFDETNQSLVGGFALSCLLSVKRDSGIMGIGNTAYCAPEQLTARPDAIEAATDVWALGIMLYELLTGRMPFNTAGGAETIRSIQSEDPVRPHRLRPDLDRTLEAIIFRCLQKQPDERYASARALADDLEHWQRAEPTAARPETLTQRILRGLSRTLRGKTP